MPHEIDRKFLVVCVRFYGEIYTRFYDVIYTIFYDVIYTIFFRWFSKISHKIDEKSVYMSRQ